MYSEYHARDWAKGKLPGEIKDEIILCEERYLKNYQWNEVGCAQNTLDRIKTLKEILINLNGDRYAQIHHQVCNSTTKRKSIMGEISANLLRSPQ